MKRTTAAILLTAGMTATLAVVPAVAANAYHGNANSHHAGTNSHHGKTNAHHANPKAHHGNRTIAHGTVTEDLGSPAADWTITFNIHARGNGNSSQVSIMQGANGPVSTFSGSVCSGSYTDPTLGGTTYYAVGPVLEGNQIYGTPYEAYVVHKGGPLGADRSWSVPVSLPTRDDAVTYCGTISTVTPAFGVVAPTSVVFAK